ncbi:radical SAM protein [Anaerosporobacter sp.]|uniref:radical SAM protein n=1 Tax=Anaerosporobacter sp. TaxID=1872529 RepID=UPI0028A0CBDC|nr:radical SAM protein [Anaerosporobacter sp.]
MEKLLKEEKQCSGSKKKILFVDFVIAEDNCNMACQYCLTGSSNFKENHKKMGIKKKLVYEEDSLLKNQIDKITNVLDKHFDMGILKVSGGEIFLIKNIVDYMKTYSKTPKIIQVLTNGLFIKDTDLEELKRYKNVCFQLSLDHHTLSGNFYRSKEETVLKKVLNSIDRIVMNDIPLEINCVLTDKNTAVLRDFAEYLMKYKGKKVMLLPFPVRGIKRDEFYPKQEQLFGVEELIQNYDAYQEVLPPKPYLVHLYEFLKTGHRKVPCMIPKCSIGVFDDGIITPCPNYWFSSFGSILDNDPEQVLSKIGTDKIYRLLLHKNNGIAECNKCFTPWEILNLYHAGYLSWEELITIPSYQFSKAKEYINE